MKHAIFTSLLVALSVMQTACGTKTERLENKVGKPVYAILTSSPQITMTQIMSSVVSTHQAPILSEATPSKLTEQQVKELRHLILNDEHYVFDMTKRCVFVPQLAYHFSTHQNVAIYVSLPCEKIKIVNGNVSVFIDYDPMSKRFKLFNQSLIKNNPQPQSQQEKTND